MKIKFILVSIFLLLTHISAFAKIDDSLFKKANEGDADAQIQIAMIYEKDDSADHFKHAFFWYSKAEQQNHSEAIYAIGSFYEFGHYVKKDTNKAIQNYKKSALLNNTQAQIALARCYETGIGVNKDLSKTIYWLKQADKLNDPMATVILAAKYINEDGVSEDLDLAYSLLLKSLTLLNKDQLDNAEKVLLFGTYVLLGLLFEDEEFQYFDLLKSNEYYEKSNETYLKYNLDNNQ